MILEKNSKIIKIISDFGISMIALSISIITLQIIVYPTLAKVFNASLYGELLTIIGVMNMTTAIFGNTLNNIRLIHDSKYSRNKTSGDFNILLVGASWVSFVVMVIVGNLAFNFTFLENIFACICVILGLLKSYLSVAYRLNLNYKMIFNLNLVTCGGYLFGTFLVYKTGMWIFPFLLGEFFSFILVILTTNLLKEPYKITNLFVKTLNNYLVLLITGLLANVSVYLDRLLIFPTLGSESVSIYTVASFFGKSLGLIMTPVSGVLLSYFAQKNFIMNHKKFILINIMFLLLAAIFFLFAMIFSVPFTSLLYPTLVNSAKPYILLANTAAISGIVASMATPFVLKYSPIYTQFVIEVMYLIIFFILSINLLNNNGLIGFCIAAICANIFKFLLLFIAGIKTFYSNTNG